MRPKDVSLKSVSTVSLLVSYRIKVPVLGAQDSAIEELEGELCSRLTVKVMYNAMRDALRIVDPDSRDRFLRSIDQLVAYNEKHN